MPQMKHKTEAENEMVTCGNIPVFPFFYPIKKIREQEKNKQKDNNMVKSRRVFINP
jgi:hypothetical protein